MKTWYIADLLQHFPLKCSFLYGHCSIFFNVLKFFGLFLGFNICIFLVRQRWWCYGYFWLNAEHGFIRTLTHSCAFLENCTKSKSSDHLFLSLSFILEVNIFCIPWLTLSAVPSVWIWRRFPWTILIYFLCIA